MKLPACEVKLQTSCQIARSVTQKHMRESRDFYDQRYEAKSLNIDKPYILPIYTGWVIAKVSHDCISVFWKGTSKS